MIRRIFRLIVLAGAAAAAAAFVRSRSAKNDPLPSPATAPADGPWPPLRNESAAPTPVDDTPPPTDAAPPAADETPSTTVAPEGPGGVPVADEPSGPGGTTWVDPADDGSCPDGYPIKAKMKSKIFHEPGQLNYDRTTPDRCYQSPATAVADGLRAAKR